MATLFRTLFGYLFRDGGHPTFYFDEAEWNLELELAASAKEEASADAEENMRSPIWSLMACCPKRRLRG